MCCIRSSISLLLIPLLLSPACAQTSASGETRPVQTLKLFVLEGDYAVNDIQSGAATAPVVEVRDQNDRPIGGVPVIFAAPAKGPGGTFGKDRIATAYTNEQGQVSANWIPNQEVGLYSITVHAKLGDLTASKAVRQENAQGRFMTGFEKPTRNHSKWLALGIVAGASIAAAAAIFAATSGGGVAASSITVKPGPISIGGQR